MLYLSNDVLEELSIEIFSYFTIRQVSYSIMSVQQQQQLFSRIRRSFRRHNGTSNQTDTEKSSDRNRSKQNLTTTKIECKSNGVKWNNIRRHVTVQQEPQKSSRSTSSIVAQTGQQSRSGQLKHARNTSAKTTATGVSSSTTSLESNTESMVLVNESTLDVLTKQLTSSLSRMKHIEEQVKIIPELKQRLDYIINNCSDDDQPVPKAPIRTTSTESMGRNRPIQYMKPSTSLSDYRAQVQANARFTPRRFVSSSGRYSLSRDDTDTSAKNNLLVDSYSLSSLRSQDQSKKQAELRDVSLIRTSLQENRSVSKSEEYDSILDDLLSLFESLEVKNTYEHPNKPMQNSKCSSCRPLESTTNRSPEQSPSSALVERNSLSLPHLTDDVQTRGDDVIRTQSNKPNHPVKSAFYKSTRPNLINKTPGTRDLPLAEESRDNLVRPANRTSVREYPKHTTADIDKFKTYFTISPIVLSKKDSMTQTNSETRSGRVMKSDSSINTDLFMDDLVTRKQLNELLFSLKLTPKQTARYFSICNKLDTDSYYCFKKKILKPSKNKSQDSSDESEDQTLSVGDTYSICSSHEDLSGFEGYFNSSSPRREDINSTNCPRNRLMSIT